MNIALYSMAHREAVKEISRGLSEATPPVNVARRSSTPEGC